MINIKMQPTEMQKLSPKISVVGVGGAGGNAVNNMISSNLEGCEFIVCNTDAQALEGSLCQNKIQLGANVTGGLGAGSKPEIGRAAAEETLEEVMQHLEGANMAFVTAGMGGGTGTGAAPVIAKACRDRGILTVGVVTKPFHFEGTHRMTMADAGIEEMQDYVDTLIVIPNQNLFRIANEKTTFAEGFRMADSVLQSGVRGVTDLMVRPGLVNLDFADVRTAMLEMGKAMMGTGEADGEKRAIEAAEAAINNPLLDDVSMKGAHGVIINVTGGYDMTLFEADEACNRIRDEVDPSANIIFGATFDESLEGVMRVSIVATGIEKESVQTSLRPSVSEPRSQENPQPSQSTLNRAQPQRLDTLQTNQAARQAQELQAMPKAPSFSPADNLRGISAPVIQESIASSSDPEGDLFAQDGLDDQAVGQEPVQNTILRGTRYNNAFIPPKPISSEVRNEPFQAISTHPVARSFHQAPVAPPSQAAEQQTKSSGLTLNPPRRDFSTEKQRSPSLFERITGTVQQHLDGSKGTETAKQRVAPAPTIDQATTHDSPAQGSLNIEKPSKPREKQDSELDIPAFLRRQAN